MVRAGGKGGLPAKGRRDREEPRALLRARGTREQARGGDPVLAVADSLHAAQGRIPDGAGHRGGGARRGSGAGKGAKDPVSPAKSEAGFTFEALEAELMNLGCGISAEPPRGSFTVADYAAYARLPYSTAAGRLSKLVEVGKLKSALFRSKSGSKQRFYWLACLLLCALFGHAQTQVDINRQTKGVLQLNRGGTGQTSWVGGRCVQVAPDGSKLEVAPAACSVEGHGHALAGDVTGTTNSTTVVRLQGRGVSSTAPSNGQSLVWNQAANLWEPRNVTIDASQVVSGTLADARVAQSNVTQHQGALQLSASQITSGVLSLARGGTGQSAWTAGTCVQVSADGTRLESTSGPCGTGGGGGGGGVGGSGSAGSLARWVTGSTLGNSSLTESTSDVSSSKPIKAELRDQGGAVFNVKAYGAKGDSSDDTAAVQSAINAAVAVGGVVYFPPGRYLVSSPLSVTGAVTIAGATADTTSANSSQIWLAGTTGNLFQIDSRGHVLIRDLLLTRSQTGSSSGAAIYVQRSAGNYLERLTIENVWTMHFAIAVDVDRTLLVNITRSYFHLGGAVQAGSAGVSIQHSDNADACEGHIQNNVLVGFESGVVTRCGSVNMVGNKFNGTSAYAWRHIQGAQASGQLTVVGNNMDTPGGRIRVETQSGAGTVIGVTIADNFLHTSGLTSGAAIELYGAGPGMGQVVIQGNMLVLNNTQSCFSIGGSIVNEVKLVGNMCTSMDSSTTYGVYNTQGYPVEASSNRFINVATHYSTSFPILRVSDFVLPYSQLGAFANGSYGYCSDCTVAAPCAGGGTGAIARRINGAWVCFDAHSHTLAGDVTGDMGSTTVAGIRGRNVSSAAPSDGQALVWSASESQWKPATVSGGGFNPLDDTVLWFREDFPNTSTTSGQIGTYGWAASWSSGGSISSVSKTGSSPFKRAYRLETGTSSGGHTFIFLGSTGSSATVLGALGSYGSWDSIFSFRNNSTASTGMVLFVGYIIGSSGTPGGGASTGRIGVEYDTSRGDTNFMFVACNGTNCTRQSSGVPFDTAWHKLRIRSQTAGTILFSLDGGTEVSINTNVSTAALAPIFGIRTEEAAAKRVEVDRWYWSGPNAQ